MLVASTLLVVLLAQDGVSLVSGDIFSSCLTAPLTLIPDTEDCHVFYQCDINQQPMSCGNMMFNSYRQVCDWPSTVLQLRPECRQEEKLRFSNQDYPYHRTLRMLRYFGDGDQFSQKRLRAPQDVGLGREKNFGNREYNIQNVNNHIDAVENEYENENEKKINIKGKQKEIEENARSFPPDIASGLQFDIKSQVLQEIRRRLPQIVKNNIPSLTHTQDSNKEILETNQENKQTKPDSTPADTVRLTLHPLKQPEQPIERSRPTSFNDLKSTKQQNAFENNLEEEELKITRQQQAVSTPADTVRLLSVHGPSYAYGQEYPAIQSQIVSSQQSQEEKEEPQPAPILVEDTREFKPVWTVTRERPRQILLRYRNMKQTPCVEKNCPQRRQRVLRKIKRKLITGEKQQLEQRRKELIQGTTAAQNTIAGEEKITKDERKAITLKEAYDRAINKVDQSQNSRPVPGNLLHEILNRDYGLKSNEDNEEYDTHNYVSSDQLRARADDMDIEE